MRTTQTIPLPALSCGITLGRGCCRDMHSKDSAPAATTKADSKGKVINTMCPIGGDEFGDHSEPALTRTWNGSAIGFCCANCVRKFDAMTPAQRDAVLAL